MLEVQSSQIIPPLLDAALLAIRKALRVKLQRKNSQPLEQYKGADVHQLGDDQNGYVILCRGEDVLYFVRYRRVSHNGFSLGRQILLWRSSIDPASVGFASHIFFDYLLPKYGALVADKQQTERGAYFWTSALEDALQRRLHVYMLDRRSRNTQLVPLGSRQDIVDRKHILWGPTPAHQLVFAVISKAPLALRPKQSTAS